MSLNQLYKECFQCIGFHLRITKESDIGKLYRFNGLTFDIWEEKIFSNYLKILKLPNEQREKALSHRMKSILFCCFHMFYRKDSRL